MKKSIKRLTNKTGREERAYCMPMGDVCTNARSHAPTPAYLVYMYTRLFGFQIVLFFNFLLAVGLQYRYIKYKVQRVNRYREVQVQLYSNL